MNLELKDIAGTAGATVGLVIATSIFLQMLTTKFISVFERYRALTDEYRGGNPSDPRRESLREQIILYYRRCQHLRLASCILTYAEFTFLATILLASLSVALPQLTWIKVLGSISMLAGLGLIAISAGLEISENRMTAEVIDSEARDLRNIPREELDLA